MILDEMKILSVRTVDKDGSTDAIDIRVMWEGDIELVRIAKSHIFNSIHSLKAKKEMEDILKGDESVLP